ncbi:hypothetical protein C8A05DRAFT_35390 [Staphylotrichum tortipilum]|uniref:Infection structure specific protein n=1 Tax=Staphylotrichum tortipilum TaxID=2831512 RepID=A0AAN6MHH6_9PEZI|nr:hypothetical protein C8A05DRAFT_35390 [Staphylotrichum longicolle]
MLSHTLLVGLASLASADMIIPRAVREMAALGAALDRRDTTTTSFQPATTHNAHPSVCSSMYTSVFSDAPQAPFDYIDFLGCDGLPSSLTAIASSYQVTAASWADAHSAEIEKLRSCFNLTTEAVEGTMSFSCSYTGSDIATLIFSTGRPTTQTTVSSTSTSSTTTASSSSATATGPAPTDAVTGGDAGANTGSRDTGLAWAAVGIAGMLGAVALL